MTHSKLKVLITRPEKQGQVLMKALTDIGIESISAPLFDYQLSEHYQSATSVETLKEKSILEQLTCNQNGSIIIFVSVAAVEYANKILPLATWHYQSLIAIGSATQLALKKLGHLAECPCIQTSEGLLALDAMQSLKGQEVIIVRGNGGREMIAQAIIAKGGIVDYFESYQRKWRIFNNDIANHWKKSGVNCIVITSNALLEQVLNLMGIVGDYWKKECLWLVASERIAKQAIHHGLSNVMNTQGANDAAIIDAINQYGIEDDKS